MMIAVTFGACLACCTIRGPNSGFWTFKHTVPVLLVPTHYWSFPLVGCKQRPVCSSHTVAACFNDSLKVIHKQKVSSPHVGRPVSAQETLRVRGDSVSCSKALQCNGCLFSGGSEPSVFAAHRTILLMLQMFRLSEMSFHPSSLVRYFTITLAQYLFAKLLTQSALKQVLAQNLT